MQTIPVAMTWEMLQRGRWSLPASALLAFSMPLLILAALTAQGGMSPGEPSTLLLHVMILQWNILIFGFAVFSAQGRTAPMYARPVRTSAIVAWRLAPAMALIALETAAFIGALNLLFNLDWPVGGPALYAAVALAAARAAFWLTEGSRWSVAAFTVVSMVLGLWFKQRYGPMFSDPEYMWRQLTVTEVFTLLGMMVLTYWVGVAGVARNRRGEAPFSLGIFARLGHWLDSAPKAGAPFRSPLAAQSWADWERKAWIVPAAVIVCVSTGLVIWLFSSRDAGELIEGFFAGGFMLCLAAFLGGIVTGNMGPSEGSYEIGNFLATRPMTTADMARVLVRTSAGSLLLAWAIWGAAFLAAVGIIVVVGAKEALHFPEGLGWWYFPAMLLASWTVLGVWMTVGLVGHSRVVLWTFVVVSSAAILMTLVSKYALTPAAQLVLEQVAFGAVAATMILGTAWAFVAARRRALVDGVTVLAAAVAWAVGCAAGAMILPTSPAPPILAYLLGAGVLALAVAPWAAAPLALAWNRHR